MSNKIESVTVEDYAMIDPSTLGERLRQLRKSKGWTLNDLAERCGVTQPFLSGLENGDKQPRLQTLENIATALDAPIHLLLDPNVPAHKLMEIADLVRRASQLSSEQLEVLHQMISTWNQ